MIIHNGLNKSEIAIRYYSTAFPDRKYNREKAKVQFQQDKKIDVSILIKIVNDIHREQLEALKG